MAVVEHVAGAPAPDEAWGTRRPGVLAALCLNAIRYRIAFGAMRKPVRWLLHRISPHYDVELEGIRMRCRGSDNLTEQRLLERGLRRNRASLTAIVGQLRPGDVFVDVGANCGLFSLFAAKAVGASGCVLAIEPAPEMTRRLRFNVKANGFSNISVIEAAASSAEGRAALHVRQDQYGLSSLCHIGATGVDVPMAPLLAIIQTARVARIDALKIDIEGYEDRVLIPFIGEAPRHLWPRRILMEVEHATRWEGDCLATLVNAGYRMAPVGKKDVLLSR